MKRLMNRVVLGVGCAFWMGLGISCRPTTEASAGPAAPPTTMPTGPGSVAIQAYASARTGDFAQSEKLLEGAASASEDPRLKEMNSWVNSFRTQQDEFSAERHKQFIKAEDNVKLLMAHHMDSYAIDEVARAFTLADDKDAFRNEPEIKSLTADSEAAAAQDENDGHWLKSMRLYADLGGIFPEAAEWKNRLKMATLRVRLLAVYAPDQLRKLQDAESKDRQAAEDLLKASTQPSLAAATTQPSTTRPDLASAASTQPDADDDAIQTTDWREVTKGIQYDMLFDALELADRQYYRDVTFQTLLEGGLDGLKAVLTTQGLEEAFPGLKDRNKREVFLTAISECRTNAENATADTAEDVLTQSLSKLRDVNQATVQLPEEVFVNEFADGAFSKLDMFSTIIWPYDMEELEKTTEGEFGGVGIQIENDESGSIKVVQPLEDTPAAKAGIRPGDLITRINGKSAKGVTLDGAVKIITGVPGTNVVLTVKSLNGDVKDYTLTREMIKVASIKGFEPTNGGEGWNYMLDPEQKIGYIRLTSFSKTTADDLGKAVSGLKDQDAKALILDLRYNPGGLLQQAKEVVNKFLDRGVIVSTHADRITVNLPTMMTADPQDFQTDLPLIILVNQYSASASEIVSGALKDQHRALIVGERTYGKGSVQMLFPLDTKKACLKLTTSHYYLPSGRCIHREDNSPTWGVDPDVTIAMTPEQMRAEIDARSKLDVPAEDVKAMGSPTTMPSKEDLLKVDPQLSAALLILRMQLSSADVANSQAAMR
jgi:carboxyl-terminal processing protease